MLFQYFFLLRLGFIAVDSDLVDFRRFGQNFNTLTTMLSNFHIVIGTSFK